VSERHFTGKRQDVFQFESIIYTKTDYRATITINRPHALNAVNTNVLEEMNIALKDASWDDGVAILVLTGAGERAFCT